MKIRDHFTLTMLSRVIDGMSYGSLILLIVLAAHDMYTERERNELRRKAIEAFVSGASTLDSSSD